MGKRSGLKTAVNTLVYTKAEFKKFLVGKTLYHQESYSGNTVKAEPKKKTLADVNAGHDFYYRTFIKRDTDKTPSVWYQGKATWKVSLNRSNGRYYVTNINGLKSWQRGTK